MRKSQPRPSASSLMRPGVDSTSELTARTWPETGAKTSLAALTLSTTAAGSPFFSALPTGVYSLRVSPDQASRLGFRAEALRRPQLHERAHGFYRETHKTIVELARL